MIVKVGLTAPIEEKKLARIRRLGVEIEHVLHAGHVRAIDLGHAPHLLAPRLELPRSFGTLALALVAVAAVWT